jgi:hypothetical protein
MEIHIREGEELTIFAKAPDGKEKTFTISFLEMMHRGETIVDGLTETEIEHLRKRKKISAIKSVRARTRMGLREAKLAVEAWIERNHCCSGWPYCAHMNCIEALDTDRLSYTVQELSVLWAFAGKITEEQARALMANAGYHPTHHGFFSFRHENNETLWASNASSYGRS